MTEISKTYESQQVESRWYEFWLREGCFTANPESPKPPYSIVIPPPNVTGILHLGHVLNNTIQDILARKARMEGFEVLWLPGTDHAGIATQVVVERKLKREEQKSRYDLGRETFLERVWEWKQKHGGIIIDQLKKLGCSCDWTRERFTMDEGYSRLVAETFVDLYHKGLIYRGNRMVNWCPVSRTALSDEEVNMKSQNGWMYFFKVEIVERPGHFLTIATTRPETIPGDTAVAVNPNDPRYADLIGLHVVRPLPRELPPEQKRIPIVGDLHVDYQFGTGVLKVTPAHDKVDFEIGQRHRLKAVDVMNDDGTMNSLAGQDLEGLDRFEARKKAADLLAELGVEEKRETYQNNVGFSERADVPIEPRLSDQWFLKYPSQEKSREVVASKELRFFPDRWAKVYDHWMSNIQDWCISRQLWWGHRIPVWYRGDEIRCQVDSPGEGWVQDPDVLDTWCSSWLWPFATMDEKTKAKFYPTTVLVTAPEILFFWVARMIMAGYEYTGQKPFRDVYLTGIVRDHKRQKMSKSLGNSPDPLEIIAEFGADALRFGIMRSAPLGQDVLYDKKQVELGRNFCTKLWNACRFRQMHGGTVEGEIDPNRLTSDDRWILLRLNTAIREMSDSLKEYHFNESANVLYRFFWSEFCDWYLEASKAILFDGTDVQKAQTLAVLDLVFSHALRLFHPFLPFITEELWQSMGYHRDLPADQGGKTILYSHWPKEFDEPFLEFYGLDSSVEQWVQAKYEWVTKGRDLRRVANVPSNKRVRYTLAPEAGVDLEGYEQKVLSILLNADPLEVKAGFEAPKGTPVAVSPLGKIYLPLEGLIDVEAEKDRLTKELEKIDKELEKVDAKLGNPNFVEKVPAEVLEDHRLRKAQWQSKKDQLSEILQALLAQ